MMILEMRNPYNCNYSVKITVVKGIPSLTVQAFLALGFFVYNCEEL